jgi:hypothetical protein
LYHDVIAYLMELPFAEEALRSALDEVSARHRRLLRTGFDLTTFAEPLQLVYREARVPLQVYDLRGGGGGTKQRSRGCLDEARRRPFDWTEAPLVRVHAVRVSDDALPAGAGLPPRGAGRVERSVALHGAGAALPGPAARAACGGGRAAHQLPRFRGAGTEGARRPRRVELLGRDPRRPLRHARPADIGSRRSG